jgi:hypothetical protein
MRLIAAGAGWCYKPDCKTGSLWHILDDNTTVKLAEVAHIVAASVSGPRANASATDEYLTGFDNLVLLCPTCHKIVDRAHKGFSLEVMQSWKQEHEAKIRSVLEIERFTSREGLGRAIDAILTKNRMLWQQYGPESIHAERIVTDVSDAWRSKVLTDIIPSNLKVSKLLDVNSHLLTKGELEIIAVFRLHSSGIEDRHLSGVINPAAPRFPQAMNSLLQNSIPEGEHA